jgi:hypothetical protein
MTSPLKSLEQCGADHCLSLTTLINQTEDGFREWLDWTKDFACYGAVQRALIRYEWQKLKHPKEAASRPIICSWQDLAHELCLTKESLADLSSADLVVIGSVMELTLVTIRRLPRVRIERTGRRHRSLQSRSITAAATTRLPNRLVSLAPRR